MAYIVMAYLVMSYIVMAYIVMAVGTPVATVLLGSAYCLRPWPLAAAVFAPNPLPPLVQVSPFDSSRSKAIPPFF